MLETRVESRGAASRLADFVHFDRRTQLEAFHGLSRAALIYALTYTCAFLGGWLAERAHREAGVGDPPIQAFVVAGVAISVALGVWLFTARHRIPVSMFTGVGMAFAIFGSLGIVGSNWHWRPALEAPNLVVVGVHWVGIWILMFPAMMVLTPRQVLFAGTVSMLWIPVVMGLSLSVEGLPEIDGVPSMAPVWSALTELLIPIAICVGIAVFLSARIFTLTRDVSRARLMGNYQLQHKIGQGGMGEVWAAKHRLLARPAAIKIIRGSGKPGSSGDTGVRRFEREAQATAALTSPNTISVFDFGTNEDGSFYYVMELLEGLNLRELVDQTGPLPQERAIHFLRQACASLADAHSHGLIHRDVKPANVYICRRGLTYDFAKVLDFGLVKSARTDCDTQLTGEGTASGTPAFMSPEMAMGSPNIDGRVDVYALGCVAYWLLTGKLVFEATSGVAMVVKHAKEPPPPMAERTDAAIDAELEQLTLDCLAKEPAGRPGTALELDGRLAAIEQRLGPWTQDRAERWWRSHLPQLVTQERTIPLTTEGSPA